MEKIEWPDIRTYYFGEPIKEGINCNACRWLNITEEQQMLVKKPSIFSTHACMLYGKPLKHRTQNLRYDNFIYPCEECNKNKNLDFERRNE